MELPTIPQSAAAARQVDVKVVRTEDGGDRDPPLAPPPSRGSPPVSSAPPDSPALAALTSWLLSSGATLSGVSIREEDSLEDSSSSSSSLAPRDRPRGLFTTCAHPPGSVLLSIPSMCCITSTHGKSTTVGSALQKSLLDLDSPNHVYLSLFLLLDRWDPASFFRPFYDTLPRLLDHVPIFWSEHDLSYLAGSPLLNEIAERKSSLDSDYHSLCTLKISPSFSSYSTNQDYHWSRSIVLSRVFATTSISTSSTGGGGTRKHRDLCLAPLADMANHRRPHDATWSSAEGDGGGLVLKADSFKGLEEGQQVFLSYSNKCNSRFLLDYGFSLESNLLSSLSSQSPSSSSNSVPVVVSLDLSDVLYLPKFDLWHRGEPGTCPDVANTPLNVHTSGLDSSDFPAASSRRIRLQACDSGLSFERLLSLTRVASANSGTEIDIITRDDEKDGRRKRRADETRPVSTSNEVRALEGVSFFLASLIKAYPTSMEEDMKALGVEKGSEGHLTRGSNRRNAVLHTLGEKRVLTANWEFAEMAAKAIKDKLREKVGEDRTSTTGDSAHGHDGDDRN